MIDDVYIMVDPEDLDFWTKKAGLFLSEEEKTSVVDYLSNTDEPLGDNVERVGKVISLPGVRTYRKAPLRLNCQLYILNTRKKGRENEKDILD